MDKGNEKMISTSILSSIEAKLNHNKSESYLDKRKLGSSVKSCEFYMRQRKFRQSVKGNKPMVLNSTFNERKTLVLNIPQSESADYFDSDNSSAQLFAKNNSPIEKPRKKSEALSQSKIASDSLFPNKSIDASNDSNNNLPHIDAIFKTYIRRFLLIDNKQTLKSVGSPEILPSTKKKVKLLPMSKSPVNLKAESLFSRLQEIITNEQEKSPEQKKKFTRHRPLMAHIKNLSNSTKKFQPTPFEASVLNEQPKNSNLNDFYNKKDSRLLLKSSILVKCPPTYSSTSTYQEIFRQFNKKLLS